MLRLSNDIWAHVLSFVHQDVIQAAEEEAFFHKRHGRAPYAEFYKLRLVCRQFNTLFDQQPDLTACVFLHLDFDYNDLPGLLGWLKHHVCVKQFVAACDNPCADVALAAMISPMQCLTTVVLRGTSSVAMGVLSAFSYLTRCELLATRDDQEVNLEPLRSLHSLADLQLHSGEFDGIGHIPHLTRLFLTNSQASVGSESFLCDSLQELCICESTLTGLEKKGLCACKALRVLDCENCHVPSDNIALNFDLRHKVCIP